jgi:hypothetical protein
MCLCALNTLRKRERNRIVELMIEQTVKIFWAVFFDYGGCNLAGVEFIFAEE